MVGGQCTGRWRCEYIDNVDFLFSYSEWFGLCKECIFCIDPSASVFVLTLSPFICYVVFVCNQLMDLYLMIIRINSIVFHFIRC